jgi:hypothetical protein
MNLKIEFIYLCMCLTSALNALFSIFYFLFASNLLLRIKMHLDQTANAFEFRKAVI